MSEEDSLPSSRTERVDNNTSKAFYFQELWRRGGHKECCCEVLEVTVCEAAGERRMGQTGMPVT